MKCISAKIHEINIENIYMHYSILYNTFTIHMNWAGYLRK